MSLSKTPHEQPRLAHGERGIQPLIEGRLREVFYSHGNMPKALAAFARAVKPLFRHRRDDCGSNVSPALLPEDARSELPAPVTQSRGLGRIAPRRFPCFP